MRLGRLAPPAARSSRYIDAALASLLAGGFRTDRAPPGRTD